MASARSPKARTRDEGCCKCGRPLLFNTADELQTRIDAYFADYDPHVETLTMPHKDNDKDTGEVYEINETIVTPQKPYTISGLVVWLETSRQT